MSQIWVLIADDHPLFRDGMHGLLDSVEETEVVGEAANGEEAVALARDLRPDVVLMDLNMPGMNGIAATREVLSNDPNVGVLVGPARPRRRKHSPSSATASARSWPSSPWAAATRRSPQSSF